MPCKFVLHKSIQGIHVLHIVPNFICHTIRYILMHGYKIWKFFKRFFCLKISNKTYFLQLISFLTGAKTKHFVPDNKMYDACWVHVLIRHLILEALLMTFNNLFLQFSK